MPLKYEDAMDLLIRSLRDQRNVSGYGYEIYLPTLVRMYLTQQSVNPTEIERQAYELISDFYAPAWDLCRRGILAPRYQQIWRPSYARRQFGERVFDNAVSNIMDC